MLPSIRHSEVADSYQKLCIKDSYNKVKRNCSCLTIYYYHSRFSIHCMSSVSFCFITVQYLKILPAIPQYQFIMSEYSLWIHCSLPSNVNHITPCLPVEISKREQPKGIIHPSSLTSEPNKLHAPTPAGPIVSSHLSYSVFGPVIHPIQVLRTILSSGAILALLLKPTRYATFPLLIGLCLSGPLSAGEFAFCGVFGSGAIALDGDGDATVF